LNNKYFYFYTAWLDSSGILSVSKINNLNISPEELYNMKISEMLQRRIVNEEQASRIAFEKDNEYKIQKCYDELEQRDIKFITCTEKEFPKKLKNIPDAPKYLFYKGKLPDDALPSVSIIGARKCDEYGAQMTKHFAAKLSQAGIQIISGMADGIDGIAGRASVNEVGGSFAVLGTGVDNCFPAANYDLYKELIQKGGVISEYVPKTPGKKYHFPRRNRIISGISDGLFVIQARLHSGTSITVDCALRQGKDVFCLPGRITDTLSTGTNLMIRDGARLVIDPDDIISEILGKYKQLILNFNQKQKEIEDIFSPDEKKILSCLDEVKAVHLDEISEKTEIPITALYGILFTLISRKIVIEADNNCYLKAVRF
jgi:DNA processing protein